MNTLLHHAPSDIPDILIAPTDLFSEDFAKGLITRNPTTVELAFFAGFGVA